jgi:MFS family permease
MGLTTYVCRLAPTAEHTATLSMGVAMNHVAAVAMPLTGGVLWATLGHRWTFMVGILAAALSVLAVLRLPKHRCD